MNAPINKNLLAVIALQGVCIGNFLPLQAPRVKAPEQERLNVAAATLAEAQRFSGQILLRHHLPNFEKNYHLLKQKCKKALDIPRIDMPVIEPDNISEFQRRLAAGHVDIFQPYAKGALAKYKAQQGDYDPFPKDLTDDERGKKWLTLGTVDGNATDDKIVATLERVPAKNLIPTQSQIWLHKLIEPIAKYGIPGEGSPVLTTTIIISKEGYILDGHHRFGQVMLSNPSLEMSVLRVPLDIRTLLKVGRSYGNAIGNRQKA